MTFIFTSIVRSLIRHIPGMQLFTAIFVVIAAAGIFLYIFYALGLGRIAKNRSVRFPYLAWIPILNLYVLGACADDETGTRKYAWLCPALGAAAVVCFVLAYVPAGDVFVAPALLIALSFGFLIAAVVLFFVALYQVYASVSRIPTALTVLSVLFSFLIPIFLYAMRENLPGGAKRALVPTKGD